MAGTHGRGCYSPHGNQEAKEKNKKELGFQYPFKDAPPVN
jgi:hypothetical protein